MTSYIITTLKTLLIFIVNQSVTSFYTTDIDLFFKISFWQGLNERKTISLCKAVVEQVTTTQSLLSICCLLLRYCIFNLLCQSSVSVVSRWVVFFGGFFVLLGCHDEPIVHYWRNVFSLLLWALCFWHIHLHV